MIRPLPLMKKQPRKPTQKKALSNWKCVDCSAETTPVKRGGPQGPATLCNACGLRLAKRKRGLNAARTRPKPVKSKEELAAIQQRQAEEELLAEEMRRKSEAKDRENARRRNETVRRRREERAREQQELQNKQSFTQSSAVPIHQPLLAPHPTPAHLAPASPISLIEQPKNPRQQSNPVTNTEEITADWLSDIFGPCNGVPTTADEFAAQARAAAERSVEGIGDTYIPEVIEAAKGFNLCFSTPNQVIPFSSPTDPDLASAMHRVAPMTPVQNHNMPAMRDPNQPPVQPLNHMKPAQHTNPQCFSALRQQTRTPEMTGLSQESMQFVSPTPVETNRLAIPGNNLEGLASLQRSCSGVARWQAEMRSIVYGQDSDSLRRTQSDTGRSIPVHSLGFGDLRGGKANVMCGGSRVNKSRERVRMTVDELMRSDAETRAQFAPKVVDDIEELLKAQQEAMEQLGDISAMLEERSNMVADEMLRSKEAIAMLNLDAARIRTLLRRPTR